jgi:hypothetical protein
MGLTKFPSNFQPDFGEIIGEITVFTENLPFGRSSTVVTLKQLDNTPLTVGLSPRI